MIKTSGFIRYWFLWFSSGWIGLVGFQRICRTIFLDFGFGFLRIWLGFSGFGFAFFGLRFGFSGIRNFSTGSGFRDFGSVSQGSDFRVKV